MPTTLSLQSWGVRGASVSLAAADATGNTAPNAGPGTVLVLRNAGAGALPVRLLPARRCSFGFEDHYLEESIPNDSARYIIGIGGETGAYSDRSRFGDGVDITYPSGVTGLTVAAANMATLRALGNADSFVAVGPSPVDLVPVVGTPTLFTAATSAGVRVRGNGQDVTLWVKNLGPSSRTVYFTPSGPCSFGFRDPESLVLAAGEEYTHVKFLPVKQFGRDVDVTYDSATGLEFAAVRMESY
jgi:hypothetical protein